MKNSITKLPTVTVAVTALNEEGNISNWLNSVLSQKGTNFKIKSIIIHSDGSTDMTNSIVKSFKDRRILLHIHKTRKGMSFRLNQIYREVETDYLIQTDADVVYGGKNVYSNLLKPLLSNTSVMMCGGCLTPIKGKTFTELACAFGFKSFSDRRFKIRGGNNIFSVTGGLMAFKKKFYKDIKIPKAMIGNDAFVYLKCVSDGYKYKFVPSAVVYIRHPQTVSDFIKERIRVAAVPLRLKKYFGERLINNELSVPYTFKLQKFLIKFFTHPFYTLFIHIIPFYCSLVAIKKESEMDGKWEMITTTKKSIKI